jgi:hypothetical protein
MGENTEKLVPENSPGGSQSPTKMDQCEYKEPKPGDQSSTSRLSLDTDIPEKLQLFMSSSHAVDSPSSHRDLIAYFKGSDEPR